MKSLRIALAAVLVVGLFAAPALAGKGKGNGKGGGANAVEGASISLDQRDPHYGDAVTFTTSYPAMHDPALIRVRCSVDGWLVWQVGGAASDPFPLGNGVDEWGGGPADCTADLYYFHWQGMTQTGPFYLADTSFHVA